MHDLEAPRLDANRGVRLNLTEYSDEFWKIDSGLEDCDSWKLERAQYFEEQRSASRRALGEGDWARALRLLEENRPVIAESGADDLRRRSYVKWSRCRRPG